MSAYARQRRFALATERSQPEGHVDDARLPDALRAAGLQAAWAVWDDAAVDWAAFDDVLVRSVWDYTDRRDDFVAWAERVEAVARLHNPAAVLRRNTDKRYLAEVPEAVPTRFLPPERGLGTLAGEVVVKPTVSAGSRDTGRFGPGDEGRIAALLDRIHASGRVAMVQPYVASVDERGETALLYFGGRFSHAVRKAALLRPGADPSESTHASEEQLTAVEPADDERALADAIVARSPEPLTYARIDLVRDAAGVPRVLELELTEPSLFFAHTTGGEERLAAALAAS